MSDKEECPGRKPHRGNGPKLDEGLDKGKVIEVQKISSEPVLAFQSLDIQFKTEFGRIHAMRGVSIGAVPGQVVALVGESGSDKSVTSTTTLGLLPGNASVDGEVTVAGKGIQGMGSYGLRSLRGRDVTMVLQEPTTALSPILTVGRQITKALKQHGVAYGTATTARAIELLKMVGLNDAEIRVKQHPHEPSGDQRQHVCIAMVILCNPEAIITDELTTALDVAVQADILSLLRSLKDKLNTSILLIIHSMGVVADMADTVHVMFKGNIVESGTADAVLNHPEHPYTQRLLRVIPHLGRGQAQFGFDESRDESIDLSDTVLSAGGLTIEYKRRGKELSRVVDGVTFDIAHGEIIGLVRESGSGESTIGRYMLGLVLATSGSVEVFGKDLLAMSKDEARHSRKMMGMVFQDPAVSLDPRFPIDSCIAEPLVVHREGDQKFQQQRVYKLFDAVSLPRSTYNRFPHGLSGGQRQRVCIARTLVLRPSLFIMSEPTSTLDISVQVQVLTMFSDPRRDFGFACLLVSYGLAVVDMLTHRVMVLQDGKIVEQGLRTSMLHDSREEYMKRLLAAAPVPEPGEQRRWREKRHKLLRSIGDEVAELKL